MLKTIMTLCLAVAVFAVLAIFICCYLLNPYFWQGFRNSKFYDKLKDRVNNKGLDTDKLIKP